MATTVSDIAKETGLAVTSVAKILRNRPGFNVNTRERVLEAARRLNYRPNHLSRALAGGKSMTVGFIHGGHLVPISQFRAYGAEHAAYEAGYLVYAAQMMGDARSEVGRRSVQDMVDRRVDGILVDYHRFFSDILSEVLNGLELPVVWVGDHTPPKYPHRVRVNFESGYRLAAEHLKSLGHKSAAFIATPTDWRDPTFKLEPARRGFEAAGIELRTDRSWSFDGGTDILRSEAQLANRIIHSHPDITAIIANNDFGAMAIMHAIRRAGGRVPEDVSVIGFDDIPISEYANPPLTSIHQARAEVGRAGFEMLLKLMKDSRARIEPVVFNADLSVRESTGPARSGPLNLR
jgi:DNA-binding LacI/PurR family transcriptional regulator